MYTTTTDIRYLLQWLTSCSGRDRMGYDADGYDRSGYNRLGYDRCGYNISGYDNRSCDILGMCRM